MQASQHSPVAAPAFSANETNLRSLAKAISWRTCGSLTTALLVFWSTGRLTLAATVGMAEAMAKFVLYFVHERVWNRIRFGKRL